MPHDPATLGLLLAALVLATAQYALLLRRRHGQERTMRRSISAISDNYGRSGLP